METAKIGFCSLGCPKNRVDGEEMLGALGEAGYTITAEAAEADVLVVHTCAFIGPAKEEAINTILEMAAHKDKGRCRGLVVTGCLAERYGQELAAQMPEVDAVLADKGDLPGTVARLLGLAAPQDSSGARLLTTPSHYAYLKLAEGCDLNCSFCAIPSFKGPFRSRPLAEVVREAQLLADMGVKELVLVAQNTTAYGRDLAPQSSLAQLLQCLVNISDLKWIRVMYAYPGQINDQLLETMAHERIAPYLDMPLQHGSPRILRAMRRPDRPKEVLRLVETLRTYLPGLALRSSFITGFPGETPADFAEVLAYLRALDLDRAGFFVYSQEEGTEAAQLPDQIPEEIKADRRSQLAAAQLPISRRRLGALVGQKTSVVIEGRRGGRLVGRTVRDAPEVDGLIYLKGRVLPGSFIEATVTGATDHDLFGTFNG